MTDKEIMRKTGLDKILNTYRAKDFVEVIGQKGGDVYTYRIYNNGSITER